MPCGWERRCDTACYKERFILGCYIIVRGNEWICYMGTKKRKILFAIGWEGMYAALVEIK